MADADISGIVTAPAHPEFITDPEFSWQTQKQAQPSSVTTSELRVTVLYVGEGRVLLVRDLLVDVRGRQQSSKQIK